MPTGYTASIKDGITFQEFALNCARAFGALITLRDAPSDTPIPDEIVQDDYYLTSKKEALERLQEAQSLTIEKAEKLALAKYENELIRVQKSIDENNELEIKYTKMLTCAIEYKAPSKDHENYRQFMIDQIKESISFDCGHHAKFEDVKLQTAQEYIDGEIKNAEWNVGYYTKKYEEECERCAARTLWIQQLKQSLINPTLQGESK